VTLVRRIGVLIRPGQMVVTPWRSGNRWTYRLSVSGGH
jgi:hypothetical protein